MKFHLCFVALSVLAFQPAFAQTQDTWTVGDGYRRYPDHAPAPSVQSAPPTFSESRTAQESGYEPIQLLDGFGAALVGLGEPILFPIDQTKKCAAEGKNNFESAGCATLSFLFSPFMAARDIIVGTGDILTFGYFRISRNVGVFDYFKPQQPASQP